MRSSKKGTDGGSSKQKRAENEKRVSKYSDDDRDVKLSGIEDSSYHGGSKGRSSRKGADGSSGRQKRNESEKKSPKDSDGDKDSRQPIGDDSPYYSRKFQQETTKRTEESDHAGYSKQVQPLEVEKGTTGRVGGKKDGSRSSKRRHEEATNEGYGDLSLPSHKASKRSRATEDRHKSGGLDPDEDRWGVGLPDENVFVAEKQDAEEDTVENRNEELERELALRNKSRRREEGGRELERGRRGDQLKGERFRRGPSRRDRDWQDDRGLEEQHERGKEEKGRGDEDERVRDGRVKGDEEKGERTREVRGRGDDEKDERVRDERGRGEDEKDDRFREGRGRDDEERGDRIREGRGRGDGEKEERIGEGRMRLDEDRDERIQEGRGRGDEEKDERGREGRFRGDDERDEKIREGRGRGEAEKEERMREGRGRRDEERDGKGKVDEEREERVREVKGRGEVEPVAARQKDLSHDEFSSARESVRDRREKTWGNVQEGPEIRSIPDGDYIPGRGRAFSPERGAKTWRSRRAYDEEEADFPRDEGIRRRRSKERKIDEEREPARHRMDFDEPRRRDIERGRDRTARGTNKDWEYHDEGPNRHGDMDERGYDGHFREDDDWGHGRKGSHYEWHEHSEDRLEESRDHKRRTHRQAAREEPVSPTRRQNRRSVSPSGGEAGHRPPRNRIPRADNAEPTASTGSHRRGMMGLPPFERVMEQRRKRSAGPSQDDDVRSEDLEDGSYLPPRRGPTVAARHDESISPPWRGGGPPGGGPGFTGGFGSEAPWTQGGPTRAPRLKGRKDERRRGGGLPSGEVEGEESGPGDFIRPEEQLEEDRGGERMASHPQMGRSGPGGSPMLRPQLAPMPSPLGVPPPPLFRQGPEGTTGVGPPFDEAGDQGRNRKVGPPNRRGEPGPGLMGPGGPPGDHWRGVPSVMGGWPPMGGPPMGQDGVFPPYRGFGPNPLPNNFQSMGQQMPPPMMFGPGRGGPMDIPYGGGRSFKGPGRGISEAGDRFVGRGRGPGGPWRGPGRGQMEAGPPPGPPGMMRPGPPHMDGWRAEWERGSGPMGGRGWEGIPWEGRGRGMPEHGGPVAGPGPVMGPPGAVFKGWESSLVPGWVPPGETAREGTERVPPAEKKQLLLEMPPGVSSVEQRSADSGGNESQQKSGKTAVRGSNEVGKEEEIVIQGTKPSKIAIAALQALVAQLPVSPDLAGLELYEQFVAILPPSVRTAQISVKTKGVNQGVDLENFMESEVAEKDETTLAVQDALEKLRLRSQSVPPLLPELPEEALKAALSVCRKPLVPTGSLQKSTVGSFVLPFEPPIISSLSVFQPLQAFTTTNFSLPIATAVARRVDEEALDDNPIFEDVDDAQIDPGMPETLVTGNLDDVEDGSSKEGREKEEKEGDERGDVNTVQEESGTKSQGSVEHMRAVMDEEDAYQDVVDYEPAPGEDEFYAVGHEETVLGRVSQEVAAIETGWNGGEQQEWLLAKDDDSWKVGGGGDLDKTDRTGLVGELWPPSVVEVEEATVPPSELDTENGQVGPLTVEEKLSLDLHIEQCVPMVVMTGGDDDVLDISDEFGKIGNDLGPVDKLEGQLEQDMKTLEEAAGAEALTRRSERVWDDAPVGTWRVKEEPDLSFTQNGMDEMAPMERTQEEEEVVREERTLVWHTGFDSIGVGDHGVVDFFPPDMIWATDDADLEAFPQDYNGVGGVSGEGGGGGGGAGEGETRESFKGLDKVGVDKQGMGLLKGAEASSQKAVLNGKDVVVGVETPCETGRKRRVKKEPVRGRTGVRQRGSKVAVAVENLPVPELSTPQAKRSTRRGKRLQT